jgi:hypothetical protein
MKKTVILIIAVSIMMICFAACTDANGAPGRVEEPAPNQIQSEAPAPIPEPPENGGEASTEEHIVVEEEEAVGIDYGPLAHVEITVDLAENGNIVQIPQLIWDEGSRPVGLELNEEILNFIGDYETYLAGSPESCEIRASHYVIGPSSINIIIIKDMQPQDGNVGEINTYVYDYRFDEVDDGASLLATGGVDIDTVDTEMTAGGYLEESETAISANLSGVVYGFMELDMLYTVTVKTAGGEEEQRLYVYRWEDELYDGDEGDGWPRVIAEEQYFSEWVPMLSK